MGNGCDGKGTEPAKDKLQAGSCCGVDAGHEKRRIDYLLWGGILFSVVFYGLHLSRPQPYLSFGWLTHMSHGVFELLNTMWWGVLFGIVFVGLLAHIPQSLIVRLLGPGGTFKGIVRATAAGVLLDLCSHGILMVGMKLYQKGASLGQVIAFLVASPWNSFSLTIIMVTLIGLWWTLLFIALSMLIAVITGLFFDRLVAKKILEENIPLAVAEVNTEVSLADELKVLWRSINWTLGAVLVVFKSGMDGSKMVVRWLLFGVLLASVIRAFVSLDVFQAWFGPSILGLLATLIAATVIEVCSEGSTPIAADLLNRAGAPGNGFLFLMAGVSTDYTEIMVIKDTMGSWKTALFLPLVTLPQIIVVAMMLNFLGSS